MQSVCVEFNVLLKLLFCPLENTSQSSSLKNSNEISYLETIAFVNENGQLMENDNYVNSKDKRVKTFHYRFCIKFLVYLKYILIGVSRLIISASFPILMILKMFLILISVLYAIFNYRASWTLVIPRLPKIVISFYCFSKNDLQKKTCLLYILVLFF